MQFIGLFSSQINAAFEEKKYVFVAGGYEGAPSARSAAAFAAQISGVFACGAFLTFWASMRSEYAFGLTIAFLWFCRTVYEQTPQKLRDLRNLAHASSWVLFTLSYCIIFYYYICAWVEADTTDLEIDPWVIHVIVIGMLLNFGCFGVVQVMKFGYCCFGKSSLLCRCGCGGKTAVCCSRCERNGRRRGYGCKNENRWKKFCRFEAVHAPELWYTFLSLLAKSLLGWWLYYNILAIGGKCGEFVAPNATAHL
jgi:hypothetical protein